MAVLPGDYPGGAANFFITEVIILKKLLSVFSSRTFVTSFCTSFGIFAAAAGVLWFTGNAETESPVKQPIKTAEAYHQLETSVTTTSATEITTTSTTTTTSSATSSSTTTSTSATTSSATTTTEETTTTTAVTEEPTEPETETTPAEEESHPVYDFSYLEAGDSPNSSYYQDRLVILGDSIAYGFNAYGYIPFEHNLATESVSIWNFDHFTFDKGGGEMGIIDAADYVDPALIYMSLGMNDLYTYTPADFASHYRTRVEEILERVPDTTIVIGSITPVSAECSFTDNDTIRSFNSALEVMVEDMGSDQVYYFDSHMVLADPFTGALKEGRSGGDGIHLGGSCYNDLLVALYNYLDTTCAVDNIKVHDGY